jgi:hypothetical protein
MKNNKDLKKLFKIFVIGFIVISSIYVLYFYNIKTIENFISSNNCSTCKISPTANKCKPIYNIVYNWNTRRKMVDISNIKTDYVFCEWEPNCTYDTMGNNILTQEERLGLSNSQLYARK